MVPSKANTVEYSNYIYFKNVETIKRIMQEVKRKRPIENKRLDSFDWWISVEYAFQEAIMKELRDGK